MTLQSSPSLFLKPPIASLEKDWYSSASENLPELGAQCLQEATGSDEELYYLTSIPSSVTYHGAVALFPWSEVENYNVTPLRSGQTKQSFQDASMGAALHKRELSHVLLWLPVTTEACAPAFTIEYYLPHLLVPCGISTNIHEKVLVAMTLASSHLRQSLWLLPRPPFLPITIPIFLSS